MTGWSPSRSCTSCRLNRYPPTRRPPTAPRKPGHDSASCPVAVRLDLLVNQADELLEQIEIFRAGDGVDLLNELAAALDPLDETLHAECGQGTAGALQRQQLVDFVRGQFLRPVRV